MKWISVEHGLPEPNEWVLVFEQRNGTGEPSPISVASFRDGKWENLYRERAVYDDLMWEIDVKKISHWMPLPLTPEQQSTCTFCQKRINRVHPWSKEGYPPQCEECWDKRYDKID